MVPHASCEARWPLALAIALRVVVWLAVPDTRFASDEGSYFSAATALLTRGEQDLFWPPLTSWLIAFVRWVTNTDSLALVRLVWIAIDIGSVVVICGLARRVAPAIFGGDAAKAGRFVACATLGYAVYLPAVSFAQFTTSETPALLLTLLVVGVLSRPTAGIAACMGAGLL